MTLSKSSPPTMSLAGKVALISGGSRGIGAATVRMFVQAGARVVFNYQKARAAADRLVAECGADRCAAIQIDLSSTEAGGKMVRAAAEKFGRVDMVIAN